LLNEGVAFFPCLAGFGEAIFTPEKSAAGDPVIRVVAGGVFGLHAFPPEARSLRIVFEAGFAEDEGGVELGGNVGGGFLVDGFGLGEGLAGIGNAAAVEIVGSGEQAEVEGLLTDENR